MLAKYKSVNFSHIFKHHEEVSDSLVYELNQIFVISDMI